jgi:hypothetical protein
MYDTVVARQLYQCWHSPSVHLQFRFECFILKMSQPPTGNIVGIMAHSSLTRNDMDVEDALASVMQAWQRQAAQQPSVPANPQPTSLNSPDAPRGRAVGVRGRGRGRGRAAYNVGARRGASASLPATPAGMARGRPSEPLVGVHDGRGRPCAADGKFHCPREGCNKTTTKKGGMYGPNGHFAWYTVRRPGVPCPTGRNRYGGVQGVHAAPGGR